MALKTYRWDMADYIETYEDIDAHLKIAYEDHDPSHVENVMNAVVRSKAMSRLAEKWAVDGRIGTYIQEQSEKTLQAYRSQPNLVAEHANHEQDTARGGYANRQLFELVQNGADALSLSDGGQIWIRLTPTHLYCADAGRAIDEDGVRALMFSHLSPKRGTAEIGRFGLGFKSVLGVTDTPEFFSQSGSFRFDRVEAAERIRSIAPDVERYPVLRLPEAIHPIREAATDPILREMMGWATNVVRLPLKPGAHQSLGQQLREFPAEFLLFVNHVGRLVLQTYGQEVARIVTIAREDDPWTLDDTGTKTRWMVVNKMHQLSADAKSDNGKLDNTDEVPISWAAPVDRLNDPGKFWAFFPTLTTSLLAGILNAPWKTNNDRQNLLPGVCNDELIDAAAKMVADALPKLSTSEDPARHLDALPRRYESGDNDHSNRLRDELNSKLKDRELVPDQDGTLRKLLEVSYPPEDLTDRALQHWAAYDGRPKNWLHHSTLTRNRLARLDRLYGGDWAVSSLPRSSMRQWLEALVESARRKQRKLQDREADHRSRWGIQQNEIDQTIADWRESVLRDCIRASSVSIQIIALIPKHVRDLHELGEIVLDNYEGWKDPKSGVLSLGGGKYNEYFVTVHPRLQSDEETLRALVEIGMVKASPEAVFADFVSDAMIGYTGDGDDGTCRDFWEIARDVEPSKALSIIKSKEHWRDSLCVRTVSGRWRSLFETLLPGAIVPADGSRDSSVTIDVQFHREDLPLLKQLGAADAPRAEHELSYNHRWRVLRLRRSEFIRRDLPRNPHQDKLIFDKYTTSGPLDFLESLSDEGKVLYTWKLLNLPDTYDRWTMRHDTQDIYPPMEFDSPAIETLREHGRIRTADGIRPLLDGLGNPPKNRAVQRKLLSHPQAALIRETFGITVETEVRVETFGEDDPIPLIDVWPGLRTFLSLKQEDLDLIRCDQILELSDDSTDQAYLVRDGSVYITREDDERDELRYVLNALGLRLSFRQIERILSGLTDADVTAARDAVRKCSTDEERLLKAVGETNLRRHLPQGLLAILEGTQGPLTGVHIAQAAIATYHTGALHEYRHSLSHLEPPRKWAGLAKAVEFVQSLGFGEEWAGERNTRRDPYIEVEGPYSLPKLHGYQREVVDNLRELIRSNGALGERRGMVSMPTGSGKTRVAVQAVVEAIREDDFKGGILWVADRDELCEQAVEAWRQVWASEGTQQARLRISRMWAGQPRPMPTGEMHVIVATIQTLSAKIARQPESYEFLADFKLLVFDEAHRSVAPTFTSVMAELGLTRWRRSHEPFLIGLTATPYRGHDVRETARLVSRYSNNRLDAGAFDSDDPQDVIQELQNMRVLAKADHATIDGGRFSLTIAELAQAERNPWLPQSAEARIARDPSRTQRIVDEYRTRILNGSPERLWPTLIFATSVEHSKVIAALLSSIEVNGRKIRARAVSAYTDRAVRRRIIEEFRSGEVNALVNYGIFREGFDAPKTRAIIVARPVYSPNLYFQMIGRGLRGVKNGGNDRCLILNVRDNIENFERKLAFSDLDWLWD